MKRSTLFLILLLLPLSLRAQNYFDIAVREAPSGPKVRFAGYTTAGVIFMEGGAGPSFDFNVGVHIGEHLYTAVEVGSHSPFIPYSLRLNISGRGQYLLNDVLCCHYIPLAAHLKVYLSHPKKFTPYLCGSVGGFFGTTDIRGLNGFYARVGVGYDLRRFSMSVGYSCLARRGALHGGFVKLGVRLGRQ